MAATSSNEDLPSFKLPACRIWPLSPFAILNSVVYAHRTGCVERGSATVCKWRAEATCNPSPTSRYPGLYVRLSPSILNCFPHTHRGSLSYLHRSGYVPDVSMLTEHHLFPVFRFLLQASLFEYQLISLSLRNAEHDTTLATLLCFRRRWTLSSDP